MAIFMGQTPTVTSYHGEWCYGTLDSKSQARSLSRARNSRGAEKKPSANESVEGKFPMSHVEGFDRTCGLTENQRWVLSYFYVNLGLKIILQMYGQIDETLNFFSELAKSSDSLQASKKFCQGKQIRCPITGCKLQKIVPLKLFDSGKRPLLLECFSAGRPSHKIIFKKDDLRADAALSTVNYAVREILRDIGMSDSLGCFKIIAHNDAWGIIEFLDNSGNFYDYLRRKAKAVNNSKLSYGNGIDKTFLRSMAATLMFVYSFGIRDAHKDNFLVNNRGNKDYLIRIDQGGYVGGKTERKGLGKLVAFPKFDANLGKFIEKHVLKDFVSLATVMFMTLRDNLFLLKRIIDIEFDYDEEAKNIVKDYMEKQMNCDDKDVSTKFESYATPGVVKKSRSVLREAARVTYRSSSQMLQLNP
eukprot:CAMPEP_0168536152 /NCGR_PEP_ID=MMETSP0405-20121227/19312_1 /TAXON_ID=498012 /ORGANISM="Trichosphaerium sp, Strain Am-I-7 wt" /LENGTH=415 /DNA_ID=CAMNT_0008563969 /DNA_START=38 /DNA_END=1286 /DNA_ORIENTATION=+